MKTNADIAQLKTHKNTMFGNEYMFLIERLADCFLTKSDGKNRILHELKEWDEESRNVILLDLSKKGVKVDELHW